MVSALLALARGLRAWAAGPFRRRLAMRYKEKMSRSSAQLYVSRGTGRSRTQFEEDAPVTLLWLSSKRLPLEICFLAFLKLNLKILGTTSRTGFIQKLVEYLGNVLTLRKNQRSYGRHHISSITKVILMNIT